MAGHRIGCGFAITSVMNFVAAALDALGACDHPASPWQRCRR